MKKNNRYFPKISKTEISAKYGIPARTAGDWSDNCDENDYRGFLADRLKIYIALEKETTETLKKLFTKNEIMALWGSLKSTLIDFSIIENAPFIAYGFEDYCLYEEMEAAQFGDIEVLKKSVTQKLAKLSSFERYCLLEYLQNEQEEIFGD